MLLTGELDEVISIDDFIVNIKSILNYWEFLMSSPDIIGDKFELNKHSSSNYKPRTFSIVTW